MKRFVSVFVIITLFICKNPVVVSALSITANDEIGKEERLVSIFEIRMEELESQANYLLGLSGADMIDIEIAQISTIYDFSGNEYTLIECSPSGYMIYHNESGVFVESSAVACSPYSGSTGERYYGGPNEYYTKLSDQESNVYKYTKSDEFICEDELSAYISVSDTLNEILVENKNTMVLDYIEKNCPISSVSPAASTVGNLKMVNNYKFFTGLNDCGYTTINNQGICGYIAAAMLLTYEQVTNGGNFVASSYYSGNSTSGYSIKPTFPNYLYNSVGKPLGYGTSTTSVAIHHTVKKYLEDRNVTASHTSLYTPLASNSVIANSITCDRPVIWFGAIGENSFNDQTNITHAIVVYGYEKSLLQYGFVAHFGWDKATIVTFTGVLGSLYTFTID